MQTGKLLIKESVSVSVNMLYTIHVYWRV